MPMLHKGDVLKDRYLVLQKIGSGGHGMVFRARDRARNRTVAIKVLRSDLADDADYVCLSSPGTADATTPVKDNDPALSDRVQECVGRCLQKDPQDRFQTPLGAPAGAGGVDGG